MAVRTGDGLTAPTSMTAPLFVGVDLSSRWFDAASSDGRQRRFDNDPAGHRAFLSWVGRPARVVVEATGTYGLDLALAVHADVRHEVMVANPRLVKGFAQVYAQRSKTDRADARTLLAFAERMPFEPWAPPDPVVLELRALGRRIEDLTVERTREKNRLRSLRATACRSRTVENDVEVNVRHLGRRIDRLI